MAQRASRSVLSMRLWLLRIHDHGRGILRRPTAALWYSWQTTPSLLARATGMTCTEEVHGVLSKCVVQLWGERGWRRQARVHGMAGKWVPWLSIYSNGRKWGSSQLRSISATSVLYVCFELWFFGGLMKTLKHPNEDSQPGRGERNGKQSCIRILQAFWEV